MTDEPKRRSYAVDDVDTIARRMKEIAAERAEAIAETELPCDVEPTAWPFPKDLTCGGATLVKQEDGNWHWVAAITEATMWDDIPIDVRGAFLYREAMPEPVPSIYSDAYWQPLIDAGILSMVEPGDA